MAFYMLVLLYLIIKITERSFKDGVTVFFIQGISVTGSTQPPKLVSLADLSKVKRTDL